jgi:pimeloyl-ACP methyl ester carboxylesterase
MHAGGRVVGVEVRWRPGVRMLRNVGVALVVLAVLLFGAAWAYLGWARVHPVDLHVPLGGITVEAAGVVTHVERWPAARPAGLPPLVLVPGFAESTYVWSRVAPRLAADRDVYAYDVRGFGFSAHTPPYSLGADTDQLRGVITALHLSRPIIVGHSSGVAIALSLALSDPSEVSAVVAANGDGTPYFGPDRSTGGGLQRALLIGPIAPAAVTAIVRHRGPIRSLVVARCGQGCPSDDMAIDRWRAPFVTDGGVDALVAILRQPLIGLTDQQETAITVPTAVLYSAEDSTFDRAEALATAARLHTDRIAGLPQARHLALLAEPDRFAAALEPELRTLTGG